MTKFDDLITYRIEESDFIDKSLDIFLILSQNVNRSNISKQAFLSIFQHEYFCDELINLIESYTNDNDILEQEAHISLIIEILYSVFVEKSNVSDLTLILYGKIFYETLFKLKEKMELVFDKYELDPINKDFFNKFTSLLNLLLPCKIFNSSQIKYNIAEGDKNNVSNNFASTTKEESSVSIKPLLNYINDNCFNNVQKYNLNEKSINEEKLKDESVKEYVKKLKLNITNHENNDVEFLDSILKKNSLINELFVAVKLVNLSVIYLFLNLNFKLSLLFLNINALNLFHFFHLILILLDSC